MSLQRRQARARKDVDCVGGCRVVVLEGGTCGYYSCSLPPTSMLSRAQGTVARSTVARAQGTTARSIAAVLSAEDTGRFLEY